MASCSFVFLLLATTLPLECIVAFPDVTVDSDCADNPSACASDAHVAVVESREADAARVVLLQKVVQRKVSVSNETGSKGIPGDVSWDDLHIAVSFEDDEIALENLGMDLVGFAQHAAQYQNVTEVIEAHDKFFLLPHASEVARQVFEFGKVFSLDPATGTLLETLVNSKEPKIGAEFGAFYGYSALRFARASKEGTVYHVVDPFFSKVRDGLFTQAGAKSMMRDYTGYSNDFLDMCANQSIKLDFLLMDHSKDLYVKDLQQALNLGVVGKGAIVMVDNYGSMAQDLVDWVASEEGQAKISSNVVRVANCDTTASTGLASVGDESGQCDVLVATVL